ncbi:MAG: YbjQ family protein [Candidatus Diapherotrites archaeon]|nr:YbjQ family protein [Candidatus Diapherotrites archaeon]
MENNLLMMTTALPQEYKIVQNFGLVTGVTCRTRGIGGKFIAGFEALAGGEVTAFTSEMEKARYQAIDRMKEKALKLGANALVGIDIETSEVFTGIVLVSATGTALVIEEKKK